MANRPRDLALELTQFLGELLHADVQFSWGDWDCNTFVLAWIDRVSGSRLAPLYRGRYDSEDSARAFAAELGYDLADVCAAAGLRVVPGGPQFAQPGDILLVADEAGPWQRGHICAGRSFVAVWPGSGVEARPMGSVPSVANTWRFA